MGTHKRVFSESYLMNADTTGLSWFHFKNLYNLVLWTKVVLALEGLTWLKSNVIQIIYTDILGSIDMFAFAFPLSFRKERDPGYSV